MSTYLMDDGHVVDTAKATESWDETTVWNGNNHVPRLSRDQNHRQRLYRSAKGRFYVVRWSSWQGTLSSAEWLEPVEAARWLLANELELPYELASFAAALVE